MTATASATQNSFEAEVMDQLRAMKAEMDSLKAENAKLRARSDKSISPEHFAEADEQPQAAEEEADTAKDWSQPGLPVSHEVR